MTAFSTELPTDLLSFFGPARVVGADGAAIRVHTGGRKAVKVRLAMQLPYEPVVGDSLLVLGRGEDYYAIGVLHGQGRTHLDLPGDVEVRASGGKLSLAGDRGVEITGPDVGIVAGNLRVQAKKLVEKLDSARRWIKGLLTLRAGSLQSSVDETETRTAKRSVILAEENVSINAKKINVG